MCNMGKIIDCDTLRLLVCYICNAICNFIFVTDVKNAIKMNNKCIALNCLLYLEL